ncbi:nuclear RNA export factor 2-like [Leguminivora glycinivorella]|uniref:nuclear RNA export factor 2-like n=1 Tax=Leguminivora glycinivorella TaxID=1035111 RepID=UPI00200C6161|nr:nuclear RNA export factor 2-like [Leguminivora glycinivorella]
MSTKRFQLENYKKYLLNRNTASTVVISYIENCIVTEDEAAKHSFHKIMVHNWPGSHIELFDTLMDYFQSSFTPVNCTSQGEITTFYTSSLNFVMKVVKHDFMFPYQRNMFNLDLLFNDRSSADCFDNRVTVDDVVAGVVSNRMSDKHELDLSNFDKDPEFIEKRIHFYKLSMLSQYKLLMIRMGRDTKSLNLSNNNLSTIPVDLLNFFIKGDLTAINLSHNEIPALSELQRISSKIEKLWIEGNPLCENLDPSTYVKNIVMRFPRLTELDGITLNQHGVMLPFFKNFLETPDKRTKMVVEKFLTLYFAHYDSNRKKLPNFYDGKVSLTINTSFTEAERAALPPAYTNFTRNALDPQRRKQFRSKVFRNSHSCVHALCSLPRSEHDPTTFSVDVLRHDKKCMILVVDGTYREKSFNPEQPDRYFRFRRTFVFNIYNMTPNSVYHINNEIFSISFATKEHIDNSFQIPIRNMNSLVLINPESEEREAISRAFTHITQLKKTEVELRLKIHSWDLRSAVKEFWDELKKNKISADKFIEDDYDDFSDTSSLIDEVD